MEKYNNKLRINSNRLNNFDYTQPFWYFVTICTQHKKNVFGIVQNDKIELNNFGQITFKLWNEIPIHFNNAELDEFVIMPNHIHGIIILKDFCRDMINHVSTMHKHKLTNNPCTNWMMMKNPNISLGKIIRYFKAKTTFQIHKLNREFKWQSNYYDHIIRNETDLYRIRKYISQNPLKWNLDEYYAF
ncbi:MAG: transposase [Ignavibacteriae bacterium]|nr:transposase [Ignavibacteriota bacterium]